MAVRRIHFRPPGVKTGSRIGPLGPFRGRLGISWVISSIAVGLVILLVGTWFLFRAPGPPFERVDGVTIEDISPGTGQKVLDRVYVGRTTDGQPFAVAEEVNCALAVESRGYRDCTGRLFGWDGRPANPRRDPLPLLPLEVHRGDIYVSVLPLRQE